MARDDSSVKTWLGILFIACMLVAASALFRIVHGQADTTICTAFRVRRASTGTVTTSVNKVGCTGVARVDTVRITRVDTVRLQSPSGVSSVAEDPRGWNCWLLGNAFGTSAQCVGDDKTVEAYSQGQTLIAGGHTFGRVRYMRNGIISATDPTPAGPPIVVPPVVVPPPVVVVPPPVVVEPPPIVPPPSTVGIATVQETKWMVGVYRDGVRIGQVAPTGNISVEPWTQWAAWRPRGTGICVNDIAYLTQAAAVAGVLAPYTGRDFCAPPVNPPELPRATVDTTMPVTP